MHEIFEMSAGMLITGDLFVQFYVQPILSVDRLRIDIM